MYVPVAWIQVPAWMSSELNTSRSPFLRVLHARLPQVVDDHRLELARR
jgi:hypothetical protein